MLLVAGWLAAPALAQEGLRGRNRDQRSDSARDRFDEPDTPPDIAGEPPFKLAISLPYAYDSNAPRSNDGRIADHHVTPEIELFWQQQMGPVRPSGNIDLLFDRYRRLKGFDSDIVAGELRLDVSRRNYAAWSPYVAYDTTYALDPGFGARQLALHDLNLGIANAWYRDPDGRSLSKQQAEDTRSFGIGFDLGGGWRFSAPAIAESAFLTLDLTFSYVFNRDLATVLESTLTLRHYVHDGSGARTDLTADNKLGISWSPQELGGIELDFVLQATRNNSSRRGVSYTDFNIGPALGFVYRF